MKELLSQLDLVLKKKNVRLHKRLGDPLTDDTIDQLSKGIRFSLPDEVKDLYKWKNGTILIDNVSLGSFWLMPLNTFNDFKSNVYYYNQSAINNSDNRIPQNFFPIFQSGGGERTFIDINPESLSFGKLFFYTLSDPDVDIFSTYSDSLSSFLKSIIECYEEDAYFCEKDGFLSSIEKRESQIFYKHNPGANYWRFYSKVYS